MKRLILVLIIMPFIFSGSLYATKVKFFQGSFISAKETAASQGKLVFVDFTARWCLPCQMMDQTTFNDEMLAEYISNSYVPVKVDIDDFDGFALKEKYKIQALPSILIFDSSGNLLDKHAEAMSASKMREVLSRYDHPENRRITSIVVDKPASTIPSPHSPPVVISKPPLRPTTPAPATPAPTPSAPVPTPAPVIRPEPVTTSPEVMPVGQGLFKFTVSRQASVGFSVQIGAFGHYGNVLQEVEKLQNQVDEPIIVNISSLRGKTVYKVMVGQFGNRQAAIDFGNYMKGIGIQGIIKDLTLMK